MNRTEIYIIAALLIGVFAASVLSRYAGGYWADKTWAQPQIKTSFSKKVLDELNPFYYGEVIGTTEEPYYGYLHQTHHR